jgi:site-specific DNA-methyltransferase (adenine-specific)
MNGETADLWLTDPPYNVAYEGSRGMTIQNDAMEDGQFRKFLSAAFGNVRGVLRPGSAFYVFHADVEGHNFRWALIEAGFRIRECLIWVKNAFALSHNDYHYKHEPILYGWNDGAAHEWFGDRSQTTILEYGPQKNNLHPTMKPVAMLVYLLSNSSKRNGIVLDTFSGPTGSAALALSHKTSAIVSPIQTTAISVDTSDCGSEYNLRELKEMTTPGDCDSANFAGQKPALSQPAVPAACWNSMKSIAMSFAAAGRNSNTERAVIGRS